MSVPVRSCSAGLRRRLMPALPLTTGSRGRRDPAVSGAGARGSPGGVGTSESPALGRGWGRRVPRRGRRLPAWSHPAYSLVWLGLGTGVAWLGGEFWSRCCCPAPPALGSIPGCPTGDTDLRLSGERGAMPGRPGRVSFLGLRGVLARTGSPSGLAQSIPLSPPRAEGLQGSRARWPAGPLAGSNAALFIQAPELAGVKHFSGIYY